MPDDSALALAATRRLPPAAVAALREAFAVEVAERLPRLRAAVAADPSFDLPVVLRDAHALGSSAVIVGEAEASRCARAAERLLQQWQADGDGTAVLADLRACVDDLARRLAGWRP